MPQRRTPVEKAASELVDNKALPVILNALREEKLSQFLLTPPDKLEGLQIYIRLIDDLEMKIRNSATKIREVA